MPLHIKAAKEFFVWSDLAGVLVVTGELFWLLWLHVQAPRRAFMQYQIFY